MWKLVKQLTTPTSSKIVQLNNTHKVLDNYPIKHSPLSENQLPSFWEILKKSYLLDVTTDRIHTILKPYSITENLLDDITPIMYKLFSALSSTGDKNILSELMVKTLANKFIDESLLIEKQNYRMRFKVMDRAGYYAQGHKKKEAEPNEDQKTEKNTNELTNTTQPKSISTKVSNLKYNTSLFSTKVTSIHFTYGPYPAPPDYISQNWFSSFITIITPKEAGEFESYPKHKLITKTAMDAGVFLKLETVIKFRYGLEFTLVDENGFPIVSFTRDRLNVSFVSPHFTPWDEIFELDDTGNWNLAWGWRIVDIDDYSIRNNKE